MLELEVKVLVPAWEFTSYYLYGQIIEHLQVLVFFDYKRG